MRLLTAALLFAILQISSAACLSQDKLNATESSCLSSGQDAVYIRDGSCMIVACGPQSHDLTKVCLPRTSLEQGLQNCLSTNLLGDVFGNISCENVRCLPKNTALGGRVQANETNSTSLVDTLTSYGTKYGTVLGAVGAGIVAVGGWYLTRRKKGKMSQYLTKIDEVYATYHENAHECEAELKKMKKSITEELKKGNLDESTFGIVDKRLDDCLTEIKEQVAKDRKARKAANPKS